MKQVIKLRWVILIGWIIAAVALTIFTPNLQQLVAEKGQISVPEEYRSQQANELLSKMSTYDFDVHDIVLIFHQEEGLTAENKQQIVQVIEALEAEKDQLEIISVLNFSEHEEIEASTVSEDGKTLLVPIEAATEEQSLQQLRHAISEKAEVANVPFALTGDAIISEDIVINSEEGLTKTIYITVALILVILFVVFRSFVAPIIPLVTIGLSYLVAEGIVSVLADTIDFPLSTFTQVFMVAIMFGIGTDYSILIISRFKEEMNNYDSIKDAVIATYKASGKTVIYAALAVLIGFSTIGLSKFTLYQSAVSVAVGVLIVTLALLTVVPFFLVLLGKKMFWPFDKSVEHKESKLWSALGHFTWTRSFLSLGIILLVTIPPVIFYKGAQTYDSIAELNENYDSVKGFRWIEDSFGPGEIMPVTVVMELNEAIENKYHFDQIESISQAIAQMKEVDKVRSATRPAGEVIEDFLLESQTEILSDGFNEMIDGVNELQDGLQEAGNELKDKSPELSEAQDGVQQLIDGTNELNDGIGQIQTYLKEIEEGMREGSHGAGEIEAGLRTIKENLDQTIAGHKQIVGNYEKIAQGLQQAVNEINANQVDFNVDELIAGINGLEKAVDTMYALAVNEAPTLATNQQFNEAYQSAKFVIEQINTGLTEALSSLNELENFDSLLNENIVAPLTQLNAGYREIIAGQEQLSAGIAEIIAGVRELKDGLSEAATGQGQLVTNMQPMREGLGEMSGGQRAFKDAFVELEDGLTELSDGLLEGADGLTSLQEGLVEVNRYLTEMDFSNQQEIVVIPDEALEMEEFWEAADMYLSPDRTIVTFEAVLNIHPYSKEAIAFVDEIDEEVNHLIDQLDLDVNTFKIGGISSVNNDLNNVSAEDYKRTATLMLIGIFIILVLLLRSLVMPIYLLASLILAYFTSIGIAEFIFVTILGDEGLTWAIPFFSFVMLIALGVDYSIFLMGRFDEYRGLILYDGMMQTMRNMGTVIISATVILGGTFAAMLPAGVLSLLQIATVVIIGLALYALVILPLLTPIFVKLLGEYNWWPFMKKDSDS